jgi:hypothetical protein
MPKDTKIVLTCKKGQAGINAAIEVDGVPDPAWSVRGATCDDVRDLHDRAVKQFGIQVEISPTCAECFPQYPFPGKD